MRLAVFADAHLPDCSDSAQEAVLRRAVNAVRRNHVDWLVTAGDMTAAGDRRAADTLSTLMRQAGLPWLSTPGNAELRTAADAEVVREAQTRPDAASPIALVDTAEGSVTAEERQRVWKRCVQGSPPIVLITHWPADELDQNSRCWFEQLVQQTGTELVIAGHKHLDAVRQFAGRPLHLVRGLDPDKAKHGLPAFALFEHRDGGWSRQDCTVEGVDPRCWPPEPRSAFLGFLGISAMAQPHEGLRQAIAHRIPCLELRAESACQCRQDALEKDVCRWRSGGGRTLSMHLPNLVWDPENQRVAGTAAFRTAVACAQNLGADYLTVHVPRVSVADLSCDHVNDAFASTYATLLAPLDDPAITVGVENLHTVRTEAAGDERRFGCLPSECLDWVTTLRHRLPQPRIGLHLDIGHARNNSPFSQSWTLGRWYAACGRHTVGYHLHQVTEKGNHQPFETPFAPLLSLASFFWAWSQGQLAHAPMFLEIRPEPGLRSWQRLRRYVLGEPGSA